MKTGAMSKLSASIIVLVMAMSALIILPGSNEGALPSGVKIYVPVSDGSGVSSGVTVTLTNVHTGEVIQAPYASPGMFVATNAPSGYYRVDVTSGDHWDLWGAKEFRYDGLTNYTVTPVITLDAFPDKVYTWNVTVRDASSSAKISGATVGFYDPALDEIVAEATTDSLGLASVNMFSSATPGDYALFIKAKNYRMYYDDTVTVTSDSFPSLTVVKSVRVTGLVTDEDGPAPNVVAYLLSNDTSLPWIERLMKSSTGGSFFEFDAVPGDYTLCVDADGVSAYMEYLTVGATAISLTLDLDAQTQRTEQVAMEFGADYNTFSLGLDTVWSYDDAYPGLKYADIGSLRMQIDLSAGSPNGMIDSGEIVAFTAMVSTQAAIHVSTDALIEVNDTVFKSATSVTGLVVGLSTGLVTSTGGVAYSYDCAYTSVNTLDVGAEEYTSTAYTRYDTASVDYVYSIELPSGYELVYNNTEETGEHVASYGYLTVVLDPEEYVGTMQAVSLVFEEWKMPDALGGVDDTNVTYVMTDEDGNVTGYVVRVGSEATFNATSSFDPNSNPLEFTWTFDDGTSETTSELTVNHTYTTASASRTVILEVTDVSGMVNQTEIEIICDARDPTPVLSVKELTVNETTNTLKVDQNELVWFNATDSSDDVVSADDGLGMIESFQIEYGEGNVSDRVYMTEDEKNVSYSWEDSGTYTLVLNVTDVVGHWKNTTMTVIVNDTSSPDPSFIVKNESWGSSLIEGEVIIFNANATKDNIDNNSALYFSWYFNDDLGADSWLNGTGLWNVTHTFEVSGSYAVRLNVTDSSDNWDGYTKTVTISAGPRPNVIIDQITFDPVEFTEDSQGFIVVNITNSGSAVATDIVVKFYIENADGTEDELGTWSTILNRTTGATITTLEIDGTAVVKFPYTFSSPGTYTVKVNVTSDNQLVVDENTSDITVKEAGWKKIALWGGVAAVIILVPLLLFLRGRWMKRDKRGPRREKQKKEKQQKEKKQQKEEEQS